MFWLFLRFVAMPYLSIRTWLRLGHLNHLSMVNRLKSHRAICAHLSNELSRMHKSVNPHFKAFEQLSWIAFVLSQLALVLLYSLENEAPKLLYSALFLIQAIAASVAGFLTFFYFYLLAQFTPQPNYSLRCIDFYLINAMHRDWCLCSSVVMLSVTFFQSSSIDWESFYSVVGFYTVISLSTIRANIFMYMSHRPIREDDFSHLKKEALPYLAPHQKRALLNAEIESESINISELAFE